MASSRASAATSVGGGGPGDHRSGIGGGHHGSSVLPDDFLSPEAAARVCQDVQHMIDINSEHLERLRTPMTSTSGKSLISLDTVLFERERRINHSLENCLFVAQVQCLLN